LLPGRWRAFLYLFDGEARAALQAFMAHLETTNFNTPQIRLESD
jgi:hypothetical protein